MGEAKRRKKLDPNYGKKSYSIEFIDFETYKRDFVHRLDDDPDLKVPKEELELFNKTFWMGYINIEDSKYSFLVLLSTTKNDQGNLDLKSKIKIQTPDNPQHDRIIDQNFNKIENELLEVVEPKFGKFLMEEITQKMLEQEYEKYYFNDDDDDDDYEWFVKKL